MQICWSIRGAANRGTAEIMKPGENEESEEAAEPSLYSYFPRESDRDGSFRIVPGPTLKEYLAGNGVI